MGRASRAKRKRRQAAQVESPVSGASVPATADDGKVFFAVSLCFILSGFAALLYQTSWLRQFSIVFGTSELAVATVLAAYMAGLGAGAAVAGRFSDNIRRPLLVYGLLEGGIAVSAISVPALLDLAGWVYVQIVGGLPQPPDSTGLAQPLYYLISSFLILALPTGFMGATLPLLTRYAVRLNVQIGPRVAWLYGINTAGAVIGALAAAFVLLPWLGLKQTIFVGAASNAIVFVIAYSLARKNPGNCDSRFPISPKKKKRNFTRSDWILPVILLSGANAFLYEVLWTRIFAHVLGGSIYAFATMLASFLTGISLGGLMAARFASNVRQATDTFITCQIAIAITSAVLYGWLQQFQPENTGLASNAITAALAMLPSTFFIGLTFPLAVRILSEDADDAPNATALVYAWNTAGAIVGSVLGGFFIVPGLGFEGAIRVAVFLNIAIASMVLLARLRAILRAAIPILASAVLLYWYQPTPPFGLIDASALGSDRGGHRVYYSVGRSATVYMKRQDGNFFLRTNGLPEAFVEPYGAPPQRHNQKWLTALPVLAKPDAESVLIIGFGGGVAVEGVPPSIASIDVVELEPDVIEANMLIKDRRRFDPLSDSRLHLILNDARNALALTEKQYDIIVSQPSHPWTAGASHLYTAEFIALGKSRLNSSGIFVQWINTAFVDEDLFRSLAATLLSQFDHVRLYQPTPTSLLFLSSDSAINPERAIARDPLLISAHPTHFANLGINSAQDLLVAFTAETEGLRRFSSGAQINTDDDNRMAMFSRALGDGIGYGELFELLANYDPLLDADSWVYEVAGEFDFPYVGERLISYGFGLRAAALARAVPDESIARTIDGIGLRHAGRIEESEIAFAEALRISPDNEQARYALVWRHLGRIAEGNSSDVVNAFVDPLTGSAAAVVTGWKHGILRDWSSLAKIDGLLAQAKPTDLWFPEAVKLRADWRIQGTTDASLNRQAMLLLDRALMVTPLTDLLVIRAGAAIRLRDSRAFVETASFVASQIAEKLDRFEAGELRLHSRDLQTMRTRSTGFLNQLDSELTRSDAERAMEVKAKFKEIARRLASL